MSEEILTQQELQAIRESCERLGIRRFFVPEYDKAKPSYARIGQIEVTGVAEIQISPDCKYGVPLCEAMVTACMEFPRLLFTVERYREALEFYGDMFNWGHPMTDGQGHVLAGCFLPGDNGERARHVLAAITADRQE